MLGPRVFILSFFVECGGGVSGGRGLHGFVEMGTIL